MATEKIYPKGIMCFPKHASAPSFVIGTVVITPNELFKWLKENESLLTEYKGEKQIKLQMLTGSKGPYMVVDTYKKDSQTESAPEMKGNDFDGTSNGSSDSLPF